jgi:hypothetical protein
MVRDKSYPLAMIEMDQARAVIAFVTAIALFGCDENGKPKAEQSTISYAPRKPGAAPVATHPTTINLVKADGPTRFASIRATIIDAGHNCASVTEATFNGGLDGTDEWSVKCSDTGDWLLWFGPGPTEVNQRFDR